VLSASHLLSAKEHHQHQHQSDLKQRGNTHLIKPAVEAFRVITPWKEAMESQVHCSRTELNVNIQEQCAAAASFQSAFAPTHTARGFISPRKSCRTTAVTSSRGVGESWQVSASCNSSSRWARPGNTGIQISRCSSIQCRQSQACQLFLLLPRWRRRSLHASYGTQTVPKVICRPKLTGEPA